jgi:hypothetical protein
MTWGVLDGVSIDMKADAADSSVAPRRNVEVDMGMDLEGMLGRPTTPR